VPALQLVPCRCLARDLALTETLVVLQLANWSGPLAALPVTIGSMAAVPEALAFTASHMTCCRCLARGLALSETLVVLPHRVVHVQA
jgi:hypothetical protein